ncbi:M1 family metallopeptidase [Alteromonas sp. a30]|uniref:M1 family metallopeptidase n=1 Tax=Alteromonas sp. a30 TaxID=2730917 RepID=UPI002282A395|nr:M1 family aminopeptidase [Alteromonas sp. a30]MCY7296748.1 M1 family metallopeptidase [Alteromonas sp. a30]
MLLRLFSYLLLTILSVLVTLPAYAQSNSALLSQDYRINSALKPLQQRVFLQLDPTQDAYSGSTQIELQLENPLSHLSFHSKGLTLHRISVSQQGKPIEVSLSQANTFDIAHILANNKAHQFSGMIHLEIHFSGNLRDDSAGLYRYQNNDETYLFSQFQPMQARTLFPLLDEPGLKTSFQFRLTLPQGYDVVHSTPITHELQNDDATQTLTFAQTARIPADVLAFAIGHFDHVKVEGLPMPSSFYTMPGQGDQAKTAAKMATDLYHLLNEYIDTEIPFQKMDFIAVPNFPNAGMENVGLIYLGDNTVLTSSRFSSSTQCHAAILIAHEIAHMWFGNYVTPDWWDDLWLNESFADWIAIKLASEYLSQPHCGESAKIYSLNDDETQAPLHRAIQNHADVEAYGQIVYEKGYAILTMFEHFIGEDEFKTLINTYLKESADGTVTSQTLLSYFQKANPDYAAMINSFINLPAYPLITLTKENNIWTLTQSPINANAINEKAPLWHVPIHLRVKAGSAEHNFQFLLTKSSMALPLEVTSQLNSLPNNALLILNPEHQGYYRYLVEQNQANYYLSQDEFTQKMWLDNQQHLAKLGKLSLASIIKQEVSLLKDAVNKPQLERHLLNGFIDHFYTTIPVSLLPKFRRYLTQQLTARLQEIYWETPNEVANYDIWVELAGIHLQYENVQKIVREKKADLLTPQPSNSAHYAQLKVLAYIADKQTYSAMQAAYKNAQGLMKEHLIDALGFVDSKEKVSAYYDFLLSDDTQGESIDYRFQFPFFNSTLRSAVFDYLKQHKARISQRIESSSLQWFPFNFMTGCQYSDINKINALFKEWQHIDGLAEKQSEIVSQISLCADTAEKQHAGLERIFSAIK